MFCYATQMFVKAFFALFGGDKRTPKETYIAVVEQERVALGISVSSFCSVEVQHVWMLFGKVFAQNVPFSLNAKLSTFEP